MKRLLIFALITITLMVSIQSCSSSNDQSNTENRSSSDFTSQSEDRLMTVEIKPDMHTNTLRMQVQLEEGRFSWLVKDPQGEIHWEDELTGAKSYDEIRELEPIPGEWRLEYSLENATGSFDIHWSGAN